MKEQKKALVCGAGGFIGGKEETYKWIEEQTGNKIK